jgi:hypothetical protein
MKAKVFAVLLAVNALAPSFAWAADFRLALGSGAPVATITLPDDWKPEAGAYGVEATSPDGASFVVAKIIKPDEKSASDYNDQTTNYIQSQGVVFPEVKGDDEPKTTDTDTKINGLDAFVSRLDENTTFKGAPTTVTYYAIPFGETQTLNVITRGAKDDKTLAAIVDTIKPLK